MRAYGFRWPVVLAATAAMLIVLFGAQFMYARQAFSQPLNAALKHTPGVLGQPVVTSDALGLVVDVKLGLVPDLESTYRQLIRAAEGSAGGRHVTLKVVDHPDPQLTQDFMNLSAILDQGRATGQFVVMERQFAAATRNMGLTRAHVTMGDQQMYVELVSGTNYLYAIMPLTLSSSAGAGGAA